jgi:hypothetical protein
LLFRAGGIALPSVAVNAAAMAGSSGPLPAAGPIVDEDCGRHLYRPIGLRDILDQRGPGLPDGRGAEATCAGDGEQRLLAEIVPAGLGVELRQDLVVFDEGCPAVEDL